MDLQTVSLVLAACLSPTTCTNDHIADFYDPNKHGAMAMCQAFERTTVALSERAGLKRNQSVDAGNLGNKEFRVNCYYADEMP